MKISALVAFAGVSAQAPTGRIYFEEDLPCENFADLFPPEDFPDMKTKCKTKRNVKRNKVKTRCNLLCLNGQENVWSTKPIKVTYPLFLFALSLRKILVQAPAKQRRSWLPCRLLQMESKIHRRNRSLRNQGAMPRPQANVQPYQQTPQHGEICRWTTNLLQLQVSPQYQEQSNNFIILAVTIWSLITRSSRWCPSQPTTLPVRAISTSLTTSDASGPR